MSKRHFIALADALKTLLPALHDEREQQLVISTLAEFCARQNPRFDGYLWRNYIAGNCGPGGGRVKGEGK